MRCWALGTRQSPSLPLLFPSRVWRAPSEPAWWAPGVRDGTQAVFWSAGCRARPRLSPRCAAAARHLRSSPAAGGSRLRGTGTHSPGGRAGPCTATLSRGGAVGARVLVTDLPFHLCGRWPGSLSPSHKLRHRRRWRMSVVCSPAAQASVLSPLPSSLLGLSPCPSRPREPRFPPSPCTASSPGGLPPRRPGPGPPGLQG